MRYQRAQKGSSYSFAGEYELVEIPKIVAFHKMEKKSDIYRFGHGLQTFRESFFFQKFETFGLGQTNWGEMFWGIWGIFRGPGPRLVQFHLVQSSV